MDDFLYKNDTYKIIGAAMAVHRFFGCGFSEKVYQDALEIEFQEQGIPFLREEPVFAEYHHKVLATEFIPDFICYNKIIVELKAVQELDDIHRAQAINYGKVANSDITLLINFGETSLKFERYLIKK